MAYVNEPSYASLAAYDARTGASWFYNASYYCERLALTRHAQRKNFTRNFSNYDMNYLVYIPEGVKYNGQD